MGLRAQIESDLSFILEDDAAGFGWPITLTAPDLTTALLVGFSTDIGVAIDPQTGQVVSGRSVSVALRISSLVAAGFATLPEGIADSTTAPWVVVFDDVNGNECTFKVAQSEPDRTIGLVLCRLELYKKL